MKITHEEMLLIERALQSQSVRASKAYNDLGVVEICQRSNELSDLKMKLERYRTARPFNGYFSVDRKVE